MSSEFFCSKNSRLIEDNVHTPLLKIRKNDIRASWSNERITFRTNLGIRSIVCILLHPICSWKFYTVYLLVNLFQSVEVQTVDKNVRTSRPFIKRKRAPIEFSLRVKNIGTGVRVRDLKIALNERGIKPRYGYVKILKYKKKNKKQTLCLNTAQI